MLRKNPDAVALTVLGLIMLIASVPRMLMLPPHPDWNVRPLTIEIPHGEIRAERDRIRDEVRREIRSAIDEAKSAIRP
jgi:hypothetical protein